jgi:hypothetical protein
LLPGALLAIALALVDPEPMTPSLSVDLDGDGSAETATASAARGGARLEVRDARGRKQAESIAPAPPASVVQVTLTAAALGSSGSLLEVRAFTDASECVSVWRYRANALARVPIQDRAGRPVADCGDPGGWVHRWERESADTPSAFVRERTETVPNGSLRRREVFVFAGFSLNADAKRSTSEINGLPIPAWYETRLYTRTALDRLYQRFDLASFRSRPELRIVADRERGVFALRFQTPGGDIDAPVDSFAAIPSEAKASLTARAGGKSFRAVVELGADGSVPTEVRVEGLSRELDGPFAPAGSWHGRAREVYPSATDEIASQYLTASWSGPLGRKVSIQIEGAPPYRVRMDQALFAVDMAAPPPAADLLLLPADAGGRIWGVALQGPNALERTPLLCEGTGASRSCRSDGPAEKLRRLGARVNVN